MPLSHPDVEKSAPRGDPFVWPRAYDRGVLVLSEVSEGFAGGELSGKTDGGSKIRAYNVGCMLPYMDYEPRTLEEIVTGGEAYLRSL